MKITTKICNLSKFMFFKINDIIKKVNFFIFFKTIILIPFLIFIIIIMLSLKYDLKLENKDQVLAILVLLSIFVCSLSSLDYIKNKYIYHYNRLSIIFTMVMLLILAFKSLFNLKNNKVIQSEDVFLSMFSILIVISIAFISILQNFFIINTSKFHNKLAIFEEIFTIKNLRSKNEKIGDKEISILALKVSFYYGQGLSEKIKNINNYNQEEIEKLLNKIKIDIFK